MLKNQKKLLEMEKFYRALHNSQKSDINDSSSLFSKP